jgi:hypothetical protein
MREACVDAAASGWLAPIRVGGSDDHKMSAKWPSVAAPGTAGASAGIGATDGTGMVAPAPATVATAAFALPPRKTE